MNNNCIIHSVPTRQSSLKEWLCYIEQLNSIVIDLTLDRVKKIAVDLNLLHPGSYIILVGGTNGKGTTCYLLESILLNSSISVGLYTSPHLLSYNERVRVHGQELPDSVHIQAMWVIENARNNIALTYFEFITLTALYIFKQKKLDVVILEVGLGGRLDATNVVNSDISVITNIELDHINYLGTNKNMIAKEKSGIFRTNKLAVIGDINIPTVVNRIAEYHGTKLFVRGLHWDFCIYRNKWFWWDCSYGRCVLLNLPFPTIPLVNAATALGVLYWLPFLISGGAICSGLQTTIVPGRFQIVSDRPLVVLDVGHNPHAANYVVRRLSMMISQRRDDVIVRVVIGMLKNKDICKTVLCMMNLVKFWYCAVLATPLSAHPMQIAINIKNFNGQFFESVLDAWNQALLDSNDNDCVLVFGSFHTVNPILRGIMDGTNELFY